jgi:arsenate reductase-like glutaredoxin family protein
MVRCSDCRRTKEDVEKHGLDCEKNDYKPCAHNPIDDNEGEWFMKFLRKRGLA